MKCVHYRLNWPEKGVVELCSIMLTLLVVFPRCPLSPKIGPREGETDSRKLLCHVLAHLLLSISHLLVNSSSQIDVMFNNIGQM